MGNWQFRKKRFVCDPIPFILIHSKQVTEFGLELIFMNYCEMNGITVKRLWIVVKWDLNLKFESKLSIN